MSKLTILTAAAALSCAAIGLAHADEETPRSRAEVIAELDAARSSGQQPALLGEDSGSAWFAQQAQASRLTREVVLAQVHAAQARGDLHALIGEDSGSMFLSTPAAYPGLIYAGPNVGPTAVATAADSGAPATA
ncbi:MAG TPA: DUF4148 domain-containing protein [Rubrivivax sp.]|nr:DUF4148 domain-containing protein [Rubrivivax sp.]